MSDEAGAGLATAEGPAGLAARGCGCLAWAAALVLAFVVVSVVIIRHDLQPHIPDLGKLVNSAGLRGLDSAATGWTGREAGRIEEGAPWLSPEAGAVLDWCKMGGSGGGTFLPVDTFGADCDRTLITYYGFDGSLPGRLVELERALKGADSSDFVSINPAFPPSPSPAGSAAPPLASEAPPVHAESLPSDSGARKVSIEVDWIERGRPISSMIDMGIQQTSEKDTRFVRYLQFRNVNPPSLARQIFRAHRYMLIIQIYAQYYHNPNVQASTLPSG